MQAAHAGATVASRTSADPREALRRTRPLKFWLIAVLLIGVWIFARFGGGLPTNEVGTFSQPVPYVAAPGGTARHIHLRAGPGAEFKVRENLERDAPVVGIARRTDSHGDFWIELADGRGFAKESVLAASSGEHSGQ